MKARSQVPAADADKLQRAIRLHQQGQLAGAEKLYREILRTNPRHGNALHYLGVLASQRGQGQQAIKLIDQSLAIEPLNAAAWSNRGNALLELGRNPEAVTSFRRAVALQPDVAEFHANLGKTSFEMGLFEYAEKCLREALNIEQTATVFEQLGVTLYRLGRVDDAIDIYRQWLDFEPDNPIPQHLVAVGSDAAPARAGDAYVAELFDKFAESFDSTLLDLGYRTPELLAAQIRTVLGSNPRPLRILDAGCGTGLAAPLLKPLASQLVGVDLSSGMLDKARERHLYDELVVGELCTFMASRPAAFDLIIIADTLVYFGELGEAFATACRALAPDGILAFTVESRPTEDNSPSYKLEPHGRYSHRPDYVTQLLVASDYTICTTEAVTLRRELKADVAGMAVVARRKPA